MTEDEQSFEDWILATTGQPYHEWLYDRKQEAITLAEEKRVADEAAAVAAEEERQRALDVLVKATAYVDAQLAALPVPTLPELRQQYIDERVRYTSYREYPRDWR